MRVGVQVCGEPATEIAILVLALPAWREEASVDCASRAWGEGHGGDDIETGDVRID